MIDIARHDSDSDPPHWNLITAAMRARCDVIAESYGLGPVMVELVLARPEDGEGMVYRLLVCFPEADRCEGERMIDASRAMERLLPICPAHRSCVVTNDLAEFETELLADELRYHEPEIKAHLAERAARDASHRGRASLGVLGQMAAIEASAACAWSTASRVFWWSWLAAMAWVIFGDPPLWALLSIAAASIVTMIYRRYERITGDG